MRYYNNSAKTNPSSNNNITAVFEIADDFSSATVNTTWTVVGTPVLSGGNITINGASEQIKSVITKNYGNAVFMANIEGAIAYNWLGYRNGDTTPVNVFILYGASNDERTMTYVSSATLNNLGSTYLNSAHLYKINWRPTFSQFYIDDSLKFNHTTQIPQTVLPLNIYTSNAVKSIICNYAFWFDETGILYTSTEYLIPSIPIFLNKTPSSPNQSCLNDSVCFNVSFDTIVNCDVYLNSTEVLGINNITELSYCNSTAQIGFWNISAICNNFTDYTFNNTTYWDWNVVYCGAPTPTPTPTPTPINLSGKYPFTHYLVSYDNEDIVISLSNQSGYIIANQSANITNIELWMGEEYMSIFSETKLIVLVLLIILQLYLMSLTTKMRIVNTLFLSLGSILVVVYVLTNSAVYLDTLLISALLIIITNTIAIISDKIGV